MKHSYMPKNQRLKTTVLVCLLAALLACASALEAMDALDNWHWRLPVPQGDNLNAIAFGNGLYVAVGEYAAILTSTNGADWETHGLEINKPLSAVAFGNGLFVAVGASFALGASFILVSSNGVDWTDVSPEGTYYLTSIVFGGGRFMAAGSVLLFSTDGRNWIDGAFPGFWVGSLAWGNGRFVALDNDFYSSTNGLLWETNTAPVSGLSKVAFLNGQFMAVGYDDDYLDTGRERPSFAFSTNGQDWTPGQLLNPGQYNSDDLVAVNAIGFINGHYLAPGLFGGRPASWISANGQFWDLLYATDFTPLPTDILSEDGRLIAVGNSGLVATSTNGQVWTQIIGPAEQINAVVQTSWGITHGNGLFVAVGLNAVQTSPDGLVWTSRTVPPREYPWNDYPWIDVTYGSNRFVAISRGALTMSSLDGRDWSVQTSVQTSGNFQLRAITYGGGKFVAVGNTIIYSADGLTWSQTNVAQAGFAGIAYGNGLFVIAGPDGRILTSTNGVNWTSNTVAGQPYFHTLTFGNGLFVAAAGNTGPYDTQSIHYSADGITWSAGSMPLGYRVERVAFASGVFLGIGDSGMIFTSLDGMNWQQRHSPTSQYLSGIASDGASFVIVGPSGAILQSDDLRPRLRLERCCFDDIAHYQLLLTGLSNCLYQVDFSNNLLDWTPRWTNLILGSEVQVFETSGTAAERFYRAKSVPK